MHKTVGLSVVFTGLALSAAGVFMGVGNWVEGGAAVVGVGALVILIGGHVEGER